MLREARKAHGKNLKFRRVDFSLVRQWVGRSHWGSKKEKKGLVFKSNLCEAP